MNEAVGLDEFDFKILTALQQDARASNHKLSQQMALSSSQIGRRILQMEENGVIQGYRVVLQPESLGLSVIAFVGVSLERHSETAVQGFAEAIKAIPEVLEAHAVTGEADYLLRVAVKDLPSLSQFVLNKLMCLSCVRSVKSSVALGPVKRLSTLPLGKKRIPEYGV